MKWQKGAISTENLYESYENKYGTSSDFQVAQKIMYSYPEVCSSMDRAFDWLRIKSDQTILDIGINNGYELGIMEKRFGRVFTGNNILGFDLAENSLRQAVKEFSKRFISTRFIKGDIREFVGIDIVTDEKVFVIKKSIDIVFAFTSLQSTSLSEDFSGFVNKLITRLVDNPQLLIVVPNCHVNSKKEIVKGLINADTGVLSFDAAETFCTRLIFELNHHGFQFKRTGEYYIFLYFYKTEKF